MNFDIQTQVTLGLITTNFKEIKKNVELEVSKYKDIVFTEEQYGEAKELKAKLNNLAKSFNNERLRIEREYMQPFNEFKSDVDSVKKYISEISDNIDNQVIAFDLKYKEQKINELKEQYEDLKSNIPFNEIYEERYSNKSLSNKKALEDIKCKLEKIDTDLKILDTFVTDPDVLETLQAKYLRVKDINKVIEEYKQDLAYKERLKALQEEKEKATAKVVEEHVVENEEPKKEKELVGYALTFEVEGKLEDLQRLVKFIKDNNIKSKKIGERKIYE